LVELPMHSAILSGRRCTACTRSKVCITSWKCLYFALRGFLHEY